MSSKLVRREIDRYLLKSVVASLGIHTVVLGACLAALPWIPVRVVEPDPGRLIVIALPLGGSGDNGEIDGGGGEPIELHSSSSSAGDEQSSAQHDTATPASLVLTKVAPVVAEHQANEEFEPVTVVATAVIARPAFTESTAAPSVSAGGGAPLGRSRLRRASAATGVGSGGTGSGGGAGSGAGGGLGSGGSRGGGGPPRPVFNPAPIYPPDALAAGLSGRVVLRTTLNRRGEVLASRVVRSSGVPSLDEAARQAVLRWRFELRGNVGTSEPIEVNVPVSFVIAGP